ncbi:hypothetical protein BX616_010704 [Lobosporangium transversale]|nr:hypothetical protein BX616_010704 [Lobosporangium transversale]
MIFTEKKLQAFRLVSLDASSAPLSDIQYVEARLDHKTQQHIILWNDIVSSYKDATHIKQENPLRIRAELDAILDVVIPSQAGIPRESYSASTTIQEKREEEPAAKGSYASNNAKSPKAGMKEPSRRHGTAATSEHASSYGATSSARPTVEERAELPALPVGGETQPRGVDETLPNIPSVTDIPDDPASSVTRSYLKRILEPKGDLKAYSDAMNWLSLVASRGDAVAQNYLGYVLYHGKGTSNDYSNAIDWFTRSASQGYASAQNNLGCMYQHGRGVPQDYSTAVNWYLQAAAQGSDIAQSNLGYMYYHGKGVPQSYPKAIDWCLKAANQGNITAQSDLGYMYLSSQDYSEAFYWLNKAANQGHTDAQNNLGFMYSRGEGVQNYSEAVDWYLKAANHGNVTAQSNLGYMYSHGKGVLTDYSTAVEWYLKAANYGNAVAQSSLGYMYFHGEGVSQDNSKALDWYLKAADQGCADAQSAIECLLALTLE